MVSARPAGARGGPVPEISTPGLLGGLGGPDRGTPMSPIESGCLTLLRGAGLVASERVSQVRGGTRVISEELRASDVCGGSFTKL